MNVLMAVDQKWRMNVNLLSVGKLITFQDSNFERLLKDSCNLHFYQARSKEINFSGQNTGWYATFKTHCGLEPSVYLGWTEKIYYA